MPAEPDTRVTLSTARAGDQGGQMDLNRDEIIGMPTGKSTVTIERGPVTRFAEAVTESNPIYTNREAARAAGFEDIPVPPTYFFSAANHWGAFPEEQPS